MNYSGADWIARQKYGARISPFGREVADILGGFAKGIYHMNETSLSKADWRNEWFIVVVAQGELWTGGDAGLTLLVLLAHDRGIRVGVKGAAPGYVRLMFSKPSESTLPSLSTSIERLRKLIGHEITNP